MAKTARPTLSSIFLALACSCQPRQGYYDDITFLGEDAERQVTVTIVDTLRLDASRTSLIGSWLMQGDRLYFIDNNVVGVKEYDLGGRYLGEHIKQGRGPEEMLSQAFSAAIDVDNGDFVFQDSNCFLYTYDSAFTNKGKYLAQWFESSITDDRRTELNNLFRKPDPENPAMYEYNFYCNRMRSKGGRLIMPVITEHVRYNGYNRGCHTKSFWRDSYTFMAFDPDDINGTRMMFGHYPDVYRQRNIPIFSAYDFALAGDSILVSFAADPAIYIHSLSDGSPLGKFGHEECGIKGDYPDTKTFDQFEEQQSLQLSTMGFYHRLFHSEGITMRTCRSDDGTWMLQIYDGFKWISTKELDYPWEVVGEMDGVYYAAISEDIDNEKFSILRFTIG